MQIVEEQRFLRIPILTRGIDLLFGISCLSFIISYPPI